MKEIKLNIDEHFKKYKEYSEKQIDLLEELKNFPKDQTLYKLVSDICFELSDNKID